MRPTSTAIQLLPLPSQFQHATPHFSAPATSACPGHRNPQPAGRTTPCSATHCRATAQRSSGELFVGWATGGGRVAGGAVTGAAATVSRVVVVTGPGFSVVVGGEVVGFTVVEVVVDDVDDVLGGNAGSGATSFAA